MRGKLLAVGLCLGALTLFSIPVVADASPSGASRASTAIPSGKSGEFSAATVTRTASGAFDVSWTAATKKVVVIALSHPDQVAGHVVGQGRGKGRIVVASLATGQQWYFKLVAGNGRSVVVTTQTLGLASAANARDMGGYRTTDGSWVKVGLLYRSPALCGLSPDEVTELNALDLKVDIDLRSQAEVDHCPAPQGLAAEFKRLGFIPEDDPMLTLNGAQTLDEYRAAFDEQGGPAGNNRSFQVSVALPHAVHVVRAVFREILGADGRPVLVNCSAGQDRTGWVAYTMLRILGVSPDIALKDYMLSAKYNAPEYPPSIDFFKALGYSQHEAELGTVVSPGRIKTTLRSIDMVFGSFDRYVRLGLGLTKADVAKLRATYVGTN